MKEPTVEPVPTAEQNSPPVPPGPLSQEEVLRSRKELAALPSLSKMRASFRTNLVRRGEEAGAAPVPQPDAPFTRVRYEAHPGKLVAYVTKDPADGVRHPAIVWITGGDTNSIGDTWSPRDPGNDQSAAAFRMAGLVMMFPSQRGGNDNPGRREGFLGEVDDIIAAHAYLTSLSYVDPKRIYPGGHSSGGTLALLVAETTAKFRAVFSFGPAAYIGSYGGDLVYCDPGDSTEMLARSPIAWLKGIRSPTFVFEGGSGNVDALRRLQQLNENPRVHLYEVYGADHFTILAPLNALIASKLIADTGPQSRISFNAAELARPFQRR